MSSRYRKKIPEKISSFLHTNLIDNESAEAENERKEPGAELLAAWVSPECRR
jgi:hypothetical protein